ncbi:acetylxylan esterase [bacterium]|nr:MAG: acetylxylan esterase [bacterium]
MPLVDMPLADLERYEGRNPRPADFDAFWDRSLGESAALPLNATTTSASFECRSAVAEDLFFDGTDGARIYAKLLRPKRPNGAAIVSFHGYSSHAGDWSDYLNWVAEGFTVAAMDCRGQGGRSTDPGGVSGTTLRGHIVRGLGDAPEKLYYRNVFLDCERLVRVVADLPDVDGGRIASIGGSQGGGLALACAALAPIKKTAPRYPFLCDYLRVWEMDLDVNAYEELRYWFRNFDPLHRRHDEVFTQLGYVDVQHLAPRIGAQTMMAATLLDSITPPSTIFAAYNKISAPKRVVTYPDFGHEGLPLFNDLTFDFLRDL